MTRPMRWVSSAVVLVVLVAAGVAISRLAAPRWFAAVDRAGRVEILGEAPRLAFAPRVSADGRRIVYDWAGRTLWVTELANLAAVRPLPGLAGARFPVWDGDGTRIFYVAESGLFFTRADGSGYSRSPLQQAARAAESWSSVNDGLTFIMLTGDDYDIWFYSMADRRATPVVALSGSAQLGSAFSPDGRWLAYESDESGEFQIHLQPFPPTAASYQVTREGGRRPMWSHDGGELYFDDGERLFVVSLRTVPSFSVGTPVALPITGFVQGDARRQYDLLPDGRFLMVLRDLP